MNSFSVNSIGEVRAGEDCFSVELFPRYRPALAGLEGFSHVQVLWWFDGCDNAASRGKLTERKPYTKGPGVLGAFATRSPERPNPIAVSTAYVTYIDHKAGVIGLAYIDASDATPVLDLKPHTPSLDRVETPAVPHWCATGRRAWSAAAASTGKRNSTSEEGV